MFRHIFLTLALSLFEASPTPVENTMIKTLAESESSTFTDLGRKQSNNSRVNENLAILDKEMRVLPVSPGTFTNDFFARSDDKTLHQLEGRVDGTLSTGDFTLTVVGPTGTSLIKDAPLNAKTALGPAWTNIPLTDTLADRVLASGKSVKSQLLSSSGGAGAAQVILRFTWAMG